MDDYVCLYENSLFSFCAHFIFVDFCLFCLFSPGPAPGCLRLQWTQFVGQLREVRYDLNPKLRRVQFYILRCVLKMKTIMNIKLRTGGGKISEYRSEIGKNTVLTFSMCAEDENNNEYKTKKRTGE